MGFRVRALMCALAGICIAAAGPARARADRDATGAANAASSIVSSIDYDGDARDLADASAAYIAGATPAATVSGDVGPRHFIQAVGDTWGVFDKSSGVLLARFSANQLWAGHGGPCASTSTDLAVVHDASDDRWVLTSTGRDEAAAATYQCLAVSKSSDPIAGGYHLYAVPLREVARWRAPSLGISADCVFIGGTWMAQDGNLGAALAAFDRNILYSGGALGSGDRSIAFLPAAEAVRVLPANVFASIPTTGSRFFAPHYVMEQGGDDTLRVRAFDGSVRSCGAGAALGSALVVRTEATATRVAPPAPTAPAKSLQTPLYRSADKTQALWFAQAGCGFSFDPATCVAGSLAVQWWSIDLVSGEMMRAPAPTGATAVARATGDISSVVERSFAGLALNRAGSADEDMFAANSALALDPADGCTIWFTVPNDTLSSSGVLTTRVGTLRDPGCSRLAPAVASKLAFAQQPTNTKSATAITPAVTVQVQDAGGVLDPTSTASITIAIGTNPGGATLSGTTTVAAVAGVATFNNLKLDKAGTGYTLTAASTGLSGATSNTFNITAGAAASLSFSTQPTNAIAGATIPVTAHVQDAAGNPISGDNVTLAIASNTGGSTLTVTANPVATNASGNAVFNGVSLNKVGSYTLRVTEASASGLTTVSNSFTISAGPPASIAFSTQPTNAVAGATIAVSAHVQDSNGNGIAADNITLAIMNNPGGSTLTVTTNPVATNGFGDAFFSGVALNKAATGYTLKVTDSSASPLTVTSTAFNISAGPPAAISFSTPPVSSAAGATIPLVAHVQDSRGNPVAGDNVTLAMVSNPGGSTLTVSANPVATNTSGDASFSGVSLNKSGTGYTLKVTDASTPALSVTSSAFTISAGAPATISFSTQPVTSTAGATIAVVAHVQDAGANPVSGDNVTLAIANNPGGSTLSVTTNPVATNAAGNATFAGVSLNKIGSGYNLKVTDASTPALTINSNGFNITIGPPAAITFSTQPSNAAAGATIPVVAHVQDAGGNPIAGDSVTLAIANNAGGATLTVTTNPVVTNASGNATFAGVSLNKSGTGYTFQANETTLSATSNAFNITAGAAAAISFSTQPANATAGSTIAVSAHVQDAGGNPVSGDNVTLAIASNPGGATLTVGTNPQATNAAGDAVFAGVSLNKPGTGYTLRVTNATALTVVSSAFNITIGPPAAISFSTQPLNATAGATIAVVAHVQDAGGNPIAGDAVTLAIANNAGGATLGVTTNPVTTNASGNATFAGVSLDKSGNGYTLSITDASTPALSVASNAFNISAGVPAAISFATQPANAAAGATIPLVAHVQDANGNPVVGDNITLAIANNAGGATLSVTANPVATNAGGNATFATVALNKVGTGYTLKVTDASTPALTVTSSAFSISAGTAATISFSTQPSSAAAGATIPVIAHVQDANGNSVAGDSVTLTIANNAGGATLAVTTNPVVTNAGGDASFGGVSLNKPATGYTLAATDASTPALSVTSNAFDISVGPAAALAFAAQPSNATAGSSIAPAVTVQVRDAGGNLVVASTASVTLAIANNPGAATLTGTTTVNATGGVATFGALSLDKIGNGYTLAASSAGLSGGTSTAFNITAGAAATIAFSTQPGNASVGATIPVVAHVQDANGNPIAGDNVTLAIASNPGGAILSVTLNPVATNAAGNAIFSGVSLDKPGTGYTLQVTDASASPLTVTSTAFNIGASAPSAISFATQPGNAVAGATIPVVVHVQDAGGNPIAGDAVTLSIASNPGTSSLSVTTNPVTTNASGNATFNGVSLNKSGTGYTLKATDASTPALNATSTAFNITAGVASQLVFTTQPANVKRANRPATIRVTEEDANGNAVNDSATVDFTIAACSGTVDLGAVAMNAGVATLNSAQHFYTLATGLRIAASKGSFSVNSATFNVVTTAEYIFADGFESCRL